MRGIPLPQPFMVVPPDGGDPRHIHDNPHIVAGEPILAVALVTPFIAQKWLHAGEAIMHPVVIMDTDRCIWVGDTIVAAAAKADDSTPASVIRISPAQAETVWTAVVAMRQAFHLPEAPDVDGVILNSKNEGQVLSGGTALFDLRKPTVMVVLLVDSDTPNDGSQN